MQNEITHVYFMPGMAASPSIFEYIRLPEDTYEIHLLEWQIPNKNESLKAYAKRMCSYIKHHNVVLVGVSFGGILVQEMSAFLILKKLIVVSSIKSRYELPAHLKLLKHTKAYKILPTQLLGKLDLLAKYAYSETIKKKVSIYQKYLSVSDTVYLDWAIKEIVCWTQEAPNPKAIYIHGDADVVFPNSCQGDTIIVKGGKHAMIITQYKWFNENLPKLITQTT